MKTTTSNRENAQWQTKSLVQFCSPIWLCSASESSTRSWSYWRKQREECLEYLLILLSDLCLDKGLKDGCIDEWNYLVLWLCAFLYMKHLLQVTVKALTRSTFKARPVLRIWSVANKEAEKSILQQHPLHSLTRSMSDMFLSSRDLSEQFPRTKKEMRFTLKLPL